MKEEFRHKKRQSNAPPFLFNPSAPENPPTESKLLPYKYTESNDYPCTN